MENNKTLVNYILILSAILFILLFTVFSLSRRSSSSNSSYKTDKSNSTFSAPTSYPLNFKNSSLSRRSSSSNSSYKTDKSNSTFPTPTSYPLNFKNKNLSTSLIPTPVSSFPTKITIRFTGVKEVEIDPKVAAAANEAFALRKQLPLKKGNLKIDFDYKKEVFVISPINNQVSISNDQKQELLNWLKENYPNLDQQKIIYSNTPYISPTPKKISRNITPVIINPLPTSTTQENGFNFLVDLFRILLDQSSLQKETTPSTSTFVDQTVTNSFSISYTPPQTQYPYKYYPQCDGPFDNYPLPGGCTICEAGCGPTTVAMIVASYKDKSVNPITIVNQYGSNGYYLGCDGSIFKDAMKILNLYGFQLTEQNILFWTNDLKPANEVVSDFKNYINAGKTLFALGFFPRVGLGHFFWIVDVDENNNIWAYDAAYGTNEIPINENKEELNPFYHNAFSVSP